MKKRISALFIAFLIALSCMTLVGAENFPSFVLDETETLSEDEIYALDELANDYYKKYNTEISYCLFDGNDSEELVSDAEDLKPATDARNRILLAVNEDFWYVLTAGEIRDSIDDGIEEAFFDISKGDDLYSGIESYIIDAGNYVTDFFDAPETETTEAESADPETTETTEESKPEIILPADTPLKNLPKASNNIKKGEGFTGKYPHIMDTAKLLTKEETQELETKLSNISENQKLELVVVTANDCEGFEVADYAERIFETCDYGYGENKDGILLLLSMEERDWYIATHGTGISALTDRRIERIGNNMVSYLSSGDYANAFSVFAEECDDYIGLMNDGDYGRSAFPVLLIPICFAVGFIIALIVVLIMKRKLKTAVRQKEANNYIKDGSFNLKESSDHFLYSSVTQSRISHNDDDSSGGGSSTHSSASGSTFGGGGGKF